MAKTEAAKERIRCINIVQEYRRELTSKYARHPAAPNAAQVLSVIQRLSAMEAAMAAGGNASKSQISVKHKRAMALEGDFSIEDMELAEIIMEEIDEGR